MRGRGTTLASNPVMVGAITVLIVILAVFLAYNANQGLPFVPDLPRHRPGPERERARARQRGADRRRPRRADRDDRAGRSTTTARLDREARPQARLRRRADPDRLDRDGAGAVVARAQVPGDREGRLRARATRRASELPLSAREARSPSTSTRCSTPSTSRPALAIQRNLFEFGDAVAGTRPGAQRRRSASSRRCSARLQPVARILSAPSTRLGGWSRASRHRRRGRARGRDPGADVRLPRHDLRGAGQRRAPVHPGLHLEGAADRGHGDRDAADDPPVPRPQRGAVRRPAPGRAGAAPERAGDRRRARGRHPGAARLAEAQRPARADRRRRCSTSPTTPGARRGHSTS